MALTLCFKLTVFYINIGNTEIQSTDEEMDLGVIVQKSFKVSSQCNNV